LTGSFNRGLPSLRSADRNPPKVSKNAPAFRFADCCAFFFSQILKQASFSGLPSLRSADRNPPKVSKNAPAFRFADCCAFFFSQILKQASYSLKEKTPAHCVRRGFSHSEVPSGLEPL
jgi:hypothetical protein